MSRKKTEINPKRADRLNEMIKRENMSQKEFGEKVGYSQQNLSKIINKKIPLTEEAAYIIIDKFPDYDIRWLLGYDDYPTSKERFIGILKEFQDESQLLESGMVSFLRLSGYELVYNHPCHGNDIESIVKNINAGCTIANHEKEIHLSLEEFNRLANKICDYVNFELDHMQ